MNINQVYISKETSFGYKLVKATKHFDLDNYNIILSETDEFYLEKKIQFKKVNTSDIGKYNFTNSKIKEVRINNGLSILKTLPKILVYIYKIISNSNKIIKNSKLIITKNLNGKIKIKGREYINKLNINYIKPDSNLCVYEIFSQSELNEIKLEIKVELSNQEIIKIIS
jgi:hypothetical protein